MTYLTYRFRARRMASVTVSPRRSASACAARHRSSGTRTPRTGVLGLFGISAAQEGAERGDVGRQRLDGDVEPVRVGVVVAVTDDVLSDGIAIGDDGVGGEGVASVGVAEHPFAVALDLVCEGALCVEVGDCGVGVHRFPLRLVYAHHTGWVYERQGVAA